MKPSPELFVLILILGVAITATIFSIHSYIRSGKYINERRDILENILLLLKSLSITDDNFLKIDTRLSSVENKDFSWEQVLRQKLNIPKKNHITIHSTRPVKARAGELDVSQTTK